MNVKENLPSFLYGKVASQRQTEFELNLYPLDEKEFIGTIWIDNDSSTENSNSIQTVIILDRSGSMGDVTRRLTNEILPLVFVKLSYRKSQVVHLITFDTTTQYYAVTVDSLKSLMVKAGGGTNLAPAIRKCHSIFQTFDATKPVRVLTISDGQVGDRQETERAASTFVEFLTSNFSINSQAVRLFTSKSQPDTKALCSLLQINNTTTTQLTDIAAKESNETIATEIAALFLTDNFSNCSMLTIERKLLLKFPWDAPAMSQVVIVPGENLFWLRNIPLKDIKIGDLAVKVRLQQQLTLTTFQSLMEKKLLYFVDHMKILKVIGTVEANKMVKLMLSYFEAKETILSEKYFIVDSTAKKKISILLAAIAKNENIKTFNSARIAEYLRRTEQTTEKSSLLDRFYSAVNINLLIIFLIVLLAIIVYWLYK